VNQEKAKQQLILVKPMAILRKKGEIYFNPACDDNIAS
jgi:hypothetical protein